MRAVMGRFATGVCVISTRAADDAPVATTVNALTSVSLEPPLLLVCLARESETLAALRSDGHFLVNVLCASQREHAARFATRGALARTHEVGFAAGPHGLPALPGSLASIACRLGDVHEAGDHLIVLGEVLASEHCDGAPVEPLLFYRGDYATLSRGRGERARSPRLRVRHAHAAVPEPAG
jgi:flavin reductase (DIM6/NTAB) family NADH-FMN oxidoreductase RutF